VEKPSVSQLWDFTFIFISFHPQLFGRNIQIINNLANATALRRPQRAVDALRAVAEVGIEEHILVVVRGPHAEAKAVTDLGPCQDEGRHDTHNVWHVVWMYHVREGFKWWEVGGEKVKYVPIYDEVGAPHDLYIRRTHRPNTDSACT